MSIGSGAAGAQGIGGSGTADLSADGRYVVFGSNANNLVAGDTNGVSDAFRRETATGVTEIVSVSALGQPVGGGGLGSGFPAVSGDGQRVVFISDAPNVVAGDTNLFRDVFLRDMTDESTIRLSIANDGTQGGFSSDNGVTSSDGQTVAFTSQLGSLVPSAVLVGTSSYVNVWSQSTEVLEAFGGLFPLQSTSVSADGSFMAYDNSRRAVLIDRVAGSGDLLPDFLGAAGTYVTPPPGFGQMDATWPWRHLRCQGRHFRFTCRIGPQDRPCRPSRFRSVLEVPRQTGRPLIHRSRETGASLSSRALPATLFLATPTGSRTHSFSTARRARRCASASTRMAIS